MSDNNVDPPMMTLQRLRVLKTHDYSKNSQTSIKVMERQMGFDGATDGIRTHGPLLGKQMLYP